MQDHETQLVPARRYDSHDEVVETKSDGQGLKAEILEQADTKSNIEAEKGQPSPTAAPATAPIQPSPAEPAGQVDHGLICWLQVVGSFALWTNSWGVVNAYGVFQTYYELELLSHNTPSQIAWVGSLQAFLLLFVGVLSGPIYDAGYFKHLVIFGNFMVVFGLMMTSICKEYWQVILAQGIATGVGFGCLFLPAIAILPQYFVKKRSFAAGVAAAGSGFGGVIYPIILRRLTPRIGFGWTVRIIAFLTLFFGIVALATLRNRVPPGKIRRLVDPAFVRNVPLVWYAFGVFFGLMGLYGPIVYLGSYALRYHILDENLAFYIVSIAQTASILGRILPTYAADRIGPVNTNIMASLGAGVLTFAWIGIKNEPGLIVFALLYGGCFGVFLALVPTCLVVLTTDMKTLGSSIGTTFGIASFGVLVGTPVSGAILNGSGRYISLQAFLASVLTVAACLIIVSRVSKVGTGIAKL